MNNRMTQKRERMFETGIFNLGSAEKLENEFDYACFYTTVIRFKNR